MEMMFIVITFMLVVLAAIYLGFFISTKAMIDAGIGRGLDYASVTRNLNEGRPTCSILELQVQDGFGTGGGTLAGGTPVSGGGGSAERSNASCCELSAHADHPWCIALSEIRSRTLAIPENTLVKNSPGGFAYIVDGDPDPVTITLPKPPSGSGITQETMFRENPIEIEVCYQARNVFGNFTRTCSSGFIMREIPTLGAYSTNTDCNGFPEGAPQFNTEPCNCDAASGSVPAVLTTSGVHTCIECTFPNTSATQETFDDDDNTGTPEVNKFDPDKFFKNTNYSSTECMCVTLEWCQANYGAQAKVANNCNCFCSGGSSGGTNSTCSCGSPPTISYDPPDVGGTVTPPVTFNDPMTESGASCTCTIQGGGELTDGEHCLPPFRVKANKCSCECDTNIPNCSNYDPNTCLCTACSGNRVPTAGGSACTCADCPPDHTQGDNCNCTIDCNLGDNGGSNQNGTACICYCGGDPSTGCTECGDGDTYG